MIFHCKKGLLFFTRIIIVLLTINEVSGHKQTIDFFETNDCKGNSTSYNDNVKNLNEVQKFKSFRVEYGAWRISESVSTDPKPNNVNITTPSSASSGQRSASKIWNAINETKICQPKPMQLEKIERIGQEDLESNSITLYASEDFMGTSKVLNDTADLGKPTDIKSWAITGTKNWALYPGKEFNGSFVCLNVTMESISSVTLREKADLQGQFQSIKIGCKSSSLKSYFDLLFTSVLLHIFLSLS